ncbi:hypothetical protein S99_03254 [Enterococcus faecalis EnGen0089]|uniref:Apea-like HEPN domain-containing protein n=2 Tax=Bacteria TaxID=2 RepID=A0A855U473_ENTFL|nr:hypothetical protein [Enterococcus faecalis]EFT98448.1 hypothetical protein HMPREF9502_00204 [Enterococcus faecalis TX0031]EGO6063837.1 hypothetical protein [Enterococcus faecalis]EKK5266634.1 hypothetical protein [Enterococcus faecalis]EOE35539.1 hypothetical protein S93_03242 [Enterococcus faecalis EnGen0106]EOE35616.1 hypothetical protein QAM_03150 [Enterococcus faecalis EnGen0070]
MDEYVKFLMVENKSSTLDLHAYICDLKKKIHKLFPHYRFIDNSLIEDTGFAGIKKRNENIIFDEGRQWYKLDIIDEDDTLWKVEFQFGTFENSLNLEVTISAGNYKLDEKNISLERLKSGIKDILYKDWEKVIWLMDKDSEILSTKLYPEIYITENLTRQFINELMIKKYGVDWWDKFVPQKITKKQKNRLTGYKSIVSKFKNVDEKLMSIDTRDLLYLISLKGSKWVPTYNTEINEFLNGTLELNNSRIKQILSEQNTNDYDLWSDLFSHYLPEDFEEKFKIFTDNRNHVMHNKLIDRDAFRIIWDSINEVNTGIKNALSKMNSEVISDEERIANIARVQQFNEEQVYNEQIIAEEEAGVSVRTDEDILSMFEEKITSYLDDFDDLLRFRDYLSMKVHSFELSQEPCNLITITRNYDQKDMQLLGVLESLSSNPGSSSIVTMYFKDYEEQFKVEYINGAYEFNEEQSNYMPITMDQFILNEEELTGSLLELIDAELENPFEQIKADVYSSKRDGGNDILLENEVCEYCGESDSIYIGKTLTDDGKCLKCGKINDLTECPRCSRQFVGGTIYADGSESFCENCEDEIEDT